MDVLTALKAMTIWPAWQHFEESDKGSIETGKLADFVILSDDPTVVDPETLADLQVRATIKEDRVIYDAHTAPQSAVLESRLRTGLRIASVEPVLYLRKKVANAN